MLLHYNADLSSCDRDLWPMNPKIFTIWPFIENLLISDNEENTFALLVAISQVQDDMLICFSYESTSATTAAIRVTT